MNGLGGWRKRGRHSVSKISVISLMFWSVREDRESGGKGERHREGESLRSVAAIRSKRDEASGGNERGEREGRKGGDPSLLRVMEKEVNELKKR